MHRPSKSYNPARSGVSAESPDIFHLNHVTVLDLESKKKAIAGKDKFPGVFYSDLKRNNAVVKARFIYEDYTNDQNFSFDTLRFNERLDLLKDEGRIRCKTPFFQKWKKQQETSEKFKIFQGEYTLVANQPCMPRLLEGKIETLQNLLRKKHNYKKHFPKQKSNSDIVRFLTAEKKYRKHIYQTPELNSKEVISREIDFFENKLALIPERKRWCYELNTKLK